MTSPLTPEEAIEALKICDLPFVSADMIAPVLRMRPDTLRDHVRKGEYELSEVDICGGRIRFARKDFLQKIGEIPPDSDEPTDHQVIIAIVEALQTMLENQKMMLQLMDEHNDLLHAMAPGAALRFTDKETASCGNS